jgi:hypothetical protein
MLSYSQKLAIQKSRGKLLEEAYEAYTENALDIFAMLF